MNLPYSLAGKVVVGNGSRGGVVEGRYTREKSGKQGVAQAGVSKSQKILKTITWGLIL